MEKIRLTTNVELTYEFTIDELDVDRTQAVDEADLLDMMQDEATDKLEIMISGYPEILANLCSVSLDMEDIERDIDKNDDDD